MRNIYLLLILFSLISCSSDNNSKDEEISKEEISKELLIKAIKINEKIRAKFFYNGNTPTLLELYDSRENLTHNEHYSFVGDTILIERIRIDDGSTRSKVKRYMISADIIRSDYYVGATNRINYSRLYMYSNNACGITSYSQLNNLGKLFFKIDYDYNDENCNSVGLRYDFNNRLESITTVTRDNKNSFLKDFKLLIGFFTHNGSAKYLSTDGTNGNILSYKREIVDSFNNNEVLTTISSQSTYEYNEFDYPVKEYKTENNGDEIIITYEYY